MIDYPIVVEPPDLIIVEVLESLPGQPITGERLVRPDGTISLDFYGTVHVRGLTPVQIKAKVVQHLRRFVSDDVLGLMERFDEPAAGAAPVAPAKPVERAWYTPPSLTSKVFVDVTAYNSKVYFVQGDVASPGRLPFTGQETVLDAINYAGGLAPTADHANVRLVRPSRGGKPARTYPINLKAIMQDGDSKANLQIFPGDRLIVGRHSTVVATIALDRLAAPINAANNTLLTTAFVSRNLLLGNPKLTPAEREAIIKHWVDLVWPAMQKGEGAVLDEKTFREALIKALTPPETAPAPKDKE